MKTINIKGKDYVPVSERIKAFREVHPNWSLTSEIISLDDTSVCIKAIIADDDGVIKATGLAQEFQSASTINKTSFVENCETSAWGRALGCLGIGVDASMASADELAQALEKQESLKKKINADAIDALKAKMEDAGVEESKILSTYKVTTFEELNEEQWLNAMRRLEKNKEKK